MDAIYIFAILLFVAFIAVVWHRKKNKKWGDNN